MFAVRMKNEILKKYHEGRLAHAFLLETNDMERCYKDILDIVKEINCPHTFAPKCKEECNICNLIDNNNLPSLITINPDGQFIKRDQVNTLMNKFSTIPVFTKYNVYIVNEAHRLNNESANALLKFLEEPEDNILGFYITNNKENVISTIRSRCQLFYNRYDDSEVTINNEILMDVKLYLNSIYKNREDLLYNKTHMSGFYKERTEWETFFTTMLYYIKDCYVGRRTDKIKLVEEMSDENVVKFILLVEKAIKYIKNNGNIDLFLDRFVIEMREYYE